MAFLRSLSIQRRVIYALLMREIITRFGRKNLGVMWIFVEPMIFTVGVAALWTAAGLNHGSNVPIVAFAITGYSSVLLWRNCVSHSVGAIAANTGLLYHRNVRVIDIFLTRSILEIAGATTSFVALSLVCIWMGWTTAPVDPAQVIFGWCMLSWLAIALALVIGAATAYSAIVEKLWQPAAYLIFPLSGAAFLVDWLPFGMREFVLWIPMVHGVEMMREGYFGNLVQTHYDISYLGTSCLILSLMGLYLVREAGLRVGKE